MFRLIKYLTFVLNIKCKKIMQNNLFFKWIILLMCPLFAKAQWSLSGNNVTSVDYFGTNNFNSIKFKTNSGTGLIENLRMIPNKLPGQSQAGAVIVNPGNQADADYALFGYGLTINDGTLNFLNPNGNPWQNQIRFYGPGLYSGIRHNIIDEGGTGSLLFTSGGAGASDVVKFAIRVAIGWTGMPKPAGYSLYVQNGILAEKVKVAIIGTANWADYVFSPT
jgi:hypothetical protein